MHDPTTRSLALVAVTLFMAAACEPKGPPSETTVGAEVAWPHGDIARGKQAFKDLGCYACHKVEGIADFSSPHASPPVNVTLGGTHTAQRTIPELFTSIVNPEHELAPGHDKKEVCSVGDCTRMGNYAWTMTVSQLVDAIAFLESTHPAKTEVSK